MRYNISLPTSWPEISFLLRISRQTAKTGSLPQAAAHRTFSGGPLVGTPHFHCRGHLSKRWSGKCVVCCAQSFLTLFWPHGLLLPGFSVHEIFPGKNNWSGLHFFLSLFQTQGSNRHLLRLLHWRWILFHCCTTGWARPSGRSVFLESFWIQASCTCRRHRVLEIHFVLPLHRFYMSLWPYWALGTFYLATWFAKFIFSTLNVHK